MDRLEKITHEFKMFIMEKLNLPEYDSKVDINDEGFHVEVFGGRWGIDNDYAKMYKKLLKDAKPKLYQRTYYTGNEWTAVLFSFPESIKEHIKELIGLYNYLDELDSKGVKSFKEEDFKELELECKDLMKKLDVEW